MNIRTLLNSSSDQRIADGGSPLPRERPRYQGRQRFLDGLRGLSATYVVMHHAYQLIIYEPNNDGVPQLLLKVLKLLDFGHYAVDVFIVLSGYCLMLPLAAANTLDMPNGIADYFRRRIFRIIPPYYAVLFLLLFSAPVFHALRAMAGVIDFGAYTIYKPANILTHILVIHNFFPAFRYTIDTPMWSVSSEWEIYFLFPLLLLPLVRKFGWLWMLLIAYTIGIIPFYACHNIADGAATWYLGLFATGMYGAWTIRPEHKRIDRIKEHLGWLTAIFWAVLLGSYLCLSGWYHSHRWIADTLVGLGSIFAIIYCRIQDVSTDRDSPPLILKLLNSKLFLGLGTISYSIYLVHFPVLEIINLLLLRYHIGALERVDLLLTVGPLAVFAVAYLCYLAFERPFMLMRAGYSRPTTSSVS